MVGHSGRLVCPEAWGFTGAFRVSPVWGRREQRHWEPNSSLKPHPLGEFLPFPVAQYLIPLEAQSTKPSQGPSAIWVKKMHCAAKKGFSFEA